MWMLSSLILFLGCPTPPDQAKQNTNNGNNMGPNNAPNNGPNNGPSGSAGQAPPNTPPEQGTATNTTPSNLNENMPPEGDGPEVANTPDNPNNTPEQAELEAQGAENQAPVQIQGEPPPQDAEPTPVTDSLLIRVERIPSKGAKAQYTQEQVKENDHVTFTGTATCDTCEGDLILRVVKFLGPNDNHSENNLITEKSIETGDFSITVPEDSTPVALELLVDKDGNGIPSAGEYFAVVEMAGALIPSKDKSGLDLDSTKRDFFAPAPIPGTQGPQ